MNFKNIRLATLKYEPYAFHKALRDIKGSLTHAAENRNEERSQPPLPFHAPRDPDERMFLRLLLMRKQQKKLPDTKCIVDLYEKAGNPHVLVRDDPHDSR